MENGEDSKNHDTEEAEQKKEGSPLIAPSARAVVDSVQGDPNRWTARATVVIAATTIIYAVISIGQWSAMHRLNNITADVNRKQIKAYILLDKGTVDISESGKSFTVHVITKNTGLTPAFNATRWIKATVKDTQPDLLSVFLVGGGEFRFKDTGEETADLGAGQPLEVHGEFPSGGSLENKTIYVWGGVKYRDMCQRCQYEVFQLRTSEALAKGKSFSLEPVGNQATGYDQEDSGCDEPGDELKAVFRASPRILEDVSPTKPTKITAQGPACETR